MWSEGGMTILIVNLMVRTMEDNPHLICNYVNDLATAFHSLYNAEKVINEEDNAKTNEKLALIQALEITIKNALNLIGVSAPERM